MKVLIGIQRPDNHTDFRHVGVDENKLCIKRPKARTLGYLFSTIKQIKIFLSGLRHFSQGNSCYFVRCSPTGPNWSACIMTPEVRYSCTSSNHPSKANYSLQNEKKNRQFPTLTYCQSQFEWSFKKKNCSKRCIPASELKAPLLPKPNFSSFRPCIAKESLKTTLFTILLSFGGMGKGKGTEKSIQRTAKNREIMHSSDHG